MRTPQAANAGLQKQSVYHAKKSPQMFADMKFRRDALLGAYNERTILSA